LAGAAASYIVTGVRKVSVIRLICFVGAQQQHDSLIEKTYTFLQKQFFLLAVVTRYFFLW